jgi:hypothetical protein
MRRRILFFLLLFCCTMMTLLEAQNLWDEDGVPIRQGKHIEWYRSADSDASGYLYVTWSDCRTGTRDIYAQKYDDDGTALWVAGGVHVIEAAQRQEDPVIVADGFGGAIIAWVDVVAYPKCNVYCQRVGVDGNRLWPAEGVALNENISAHSPVNIASDGSGGAFVTWKDVRSDEAGDIYLVRVTSEGSITPDWPQNGKAICTGSGEQSGASIGSDGSGGAILTWKDKRNGTDYDIYAQRVRGDGGLHWESGEQCICDMTKDQDQVKLWSDGDQGAIIVWRDRRGGSYTDIYAQRIDSSGEVLWAPQGQIICGAAGNQEDPRLVNDGADGAIFTWKDHRNNPYDWDIYAQRVNSSGSKIWAPDDVPICTAPRDQIEVRLTLVDTGEAVIVWVDQRDEGSPLGDIYAQRVNSLGTVQWTTDGEAVCIAPAAQFSPLLRSDVSTGAYAIWGDYRSGSIGIYAQRISRDGTLQWNSTGQAVVEGISGNATHLQIVEGSDGAIMIWEDGRRGSLGTYVYAQKIDVNGSVQWTNNGVGVDTTDAGSQSKPVVSGDGAGGAYFAWEDRRDGVMQIYVRRFTADGTPDWPEALRVCVTPNDQNDPHIARTGGGSAVLAWSDIRSGMDYDVYVQRIDSLGNLQWAPEGIRVSASGYDEYASGAVDLGDGSSIVLWQGGSWDNQDIYAQKLDADGNISPGWPEGGLPLCVASGQQIEPRLIPDGEGGAIFVWEDSRFGAKDIYSQRVNSNGDLMWTTGGADSLNGFPVCQAQNDQSSPSVAGDSQSGYSIAWHDYRNMSNGNDIYVQRLNLSGTAQWDADGIGLAAVAGDQFSPVLISGAEGKIIAVWEDNRSAVTILDLYAQNIDASGTVHWEINGAPVIQYYHKQSTPKGAADTEGGAFVAWEDMRSSGKSDSHDIYAQRLSGASVQLRGDVTNDGNINVLDVLATLNHILGIMPLDESGQWRADCSGDGQINVLDALGIANVILGLGNCAP